MAFDKSTAFGRMAGSSRLRYVLLGLLIGTTGLAQTTGKYLIQLRDKTGTPYSVGQPQAFLSARAVLRRQKQNIAVTERDLPVNPAYVAAIRQTGAIVWYTSRWLNAVLIEATDATLTAVRQLPFVSGLEGGRSLATLPKALPRSAATNRPPAAVGADRVGAGGPLNYGASASQITQIGADQMHAQGYHGEGLLIGVLDAGFLNANQVSFLRPLFTENRVPATYDFVQREPNVYDDDEHGTEVLSVMAATADGQLYGTAYGASYVLLRTEDADTEKPIEEANWLFGAEYADSAGVDVINSSLGYTTFDPPFNTLDHTYADLNGTTTLISRAAQWAAETGMVVVNSAGNEGSDGWQRIIVPADAVSVLAVGGVDQNGYYWPVSSIGPSTDGRVKPDLAARSVGTVVGTPAGTIRTGNGTSFASPLVAGLAAGFWQAHPTLTAAQVTAALRQSGSQYTRPDNQLGYGIPDFGRASVVAQSFGRARAYPNPFSDGEPLTVQWADAGANVPFSAQLCDLTGRVLWRGQTAAGGSVFRLPNLTLAAGLYVVTVTAGDQKQAFRVIKR